MKSRNSFGKVHRTIFICLYISIHAIFGSSLKGQTAVDAFKPGEILLRVRNGARIEDVMKRDSQLAGASVNGVIRSMNIYLIKLGSSIETESFVQKLNLDRDVLFAKQNYFVGMDLCASPNDTQYGAQYAMPLIEADRAWDISTGGYDALGHEIVVAVLDGGFDLGHPDISYWTNANEVPDNGVDDDNNGYVDDVMGWNALTQSGALTSDDHGTHVAGIIGAKGNNAQGVTGVNWTVRIMPIQVTNGANTTEADILGAYGYIMDSRRDYDESNGDSGAFIVATNASFSKDGWHPDEHGAWCDVFDELGALGILNISTTQNEPYEIDTEPSWPWNSPNYSMPAMCSSPYLIIVANTDAADELASNASWSVEHIDIAAPGVFILSTIAGGTGLNSGTSMAAPLVAGTVALIHAAACMNFAEAYSNSPATVALDIRNAIINRADFVPALIPKIGGGRLNVYRSISYFLDNYQTNVTVTGSQNGNESYNAINAILFDDYSSSSNIIARAGKSITIHDITTLTPSSGLSQLFEIDPTTFACAVPYEPLGLGMIIPSPTLCGLPLGTAYNAVVSGGVPPYTYHWQSRLTTSSSWYSYSANGPTCIVYRADDFFLQVSVVDAVGNTASAGPTLVICANGMVLEESQITMNDRMSCLVWPNPTTDVSNLRIRSPENGNATVRIYDAVGHLIGQQQSIAVEANVYRDVALNMPRAKGLYVVEIEMLGQVAQQRLILAYE